MKRKNGFSMIELLIVVAIILIIAAIAIPNLLRARIAANESSAVGSIRTIRTAEVVYFNTYSTIGYANTLGELGGVTPCTASSSTGCLIDNFLATATVGGSGKSGYVFAATGLASGGSTINSAFVVGGSPVMWNQTGQRNFCSTNDGVLRFNYGAAGSTPVTDLASCWGFPTAQ